MISHNYVLKDFFSFLKVVRQISYHPNIRVNFDK